MTGRNRKDKERTGWDRILLNMKGEETTGKGRKG